MSYRTEHGHSPASPAWGMDPFDYGMDASRRGEQWNRSTDRQHEGNSYAGIEEAEAPVRRWPEAAVRAPVPARSTRGEPVGVAALPVAPGGQRGRGPRGYVRPDERILEDVCDCLFVDDEVDASEVTVDVDDGVVRLEGVVAAPWEKRRIENLVRACSGVRELHNLLRVRSIAA
jgi:osmotically-inducible protein OsmY